MSNISYKIYWRLFVQLRHQTEHFVKCSCRSSQAKKFERMVAIKICAKCPFYSKWILLFSKVVGDPGFSLQKELVFSQKEKCFPVNFAKFLKQFFYRILATTSAAVLEISELGKRWITWITFALFYTFSTLLSMKIIQAGGCHDLSPLTFHSHCFII